MHALNSTNPGAPSARRAVSTVVCACVLQWLTLVTQTLQDRQVPRREANGEQINVH